VKDEKSKKEKSLGDQMNEFGVIYSWSFISINRGIYIKKKTKF